MKFLESPIGGVFVVRAHSVSDERGRFSRVFSVDDFAAQGLNPYVSQCSVSVNPERHTLRGLHYQREPHQEAKLIRCAQGRVFDVAVDLRPDSESYCRWFGLELSGDGPDMLYIPEGCAHGFLTLEPGTDIHYQITSPYAPEQAAGVRWDDPAFSIEWPGMPRVISERDRNYPDFEP